MGSLDELHALLAMPEAPSFRDTLSADTGDAALHFAAWKGQVACLAALLAAGCNAGRRNRRWGHTPLHWAALNGWPQCVAALLAAGADSLARDRQGKTPEEVRENDRVTTDELWAASLGRIKTCACDFWLLMLLTLLIDDMCSRTPSGICHST